MAEFLPPPPPRSPGYLNPDIRRVLGDVIATLQGRGPLADAQFRADVGRNAGDVPHGAARGISADLLGAPVDAVASVMSIPRMMGMASAPDFRERPFGGSQQIGELLQRFGLLRAPTGSPAETVGRVVGGAMASPGVVGPVMKTAEDALIHGALGLSQPSPLTVWHGTPHRFQPEPGKPLGGFRSDKIGTGEGKQQQGHGIYLTETKDIAAKYADKESAKRGMESGFVYKVDMPDAAAQKMAVHELPFAMQPQNVKAAIAPMFGDAELQALKGYHGWDRLEEAPFSAVLDTLEVVRGNSRKQVAESLQKAGIPGISYLDGSSRSAGQGTRNFVVFPGNEDLLKILERQ